MFDSALRVFHKQVFSEIGKTRLLQKHLPKCNFPSKLGGLGIVTLANTFKVFLNSYFIWNESRVSLSSSLWQVMEPNSESMVNIWGSLSDGE